MLVLEVLEVDLDVDLMQLFDSCQLFGPGWILYWMPIDLFWLSCY